MNLAVTDALSGAYLPLEAQLLKESPAEARALYLGLQRAFLIAGTVFALAIIGGGRTWLRFIAPESNSELIDITQAMLVALAVGAPAYLHSNLLCYLEMAHNSFRLSSIRATLQSIGIIVGIVLAHALDRPTLIAWGFSAAYILMSLYGERYLRSRNYLAMGKSLERVPFRSVARSFLRRARPLALIPVLWQIQAVAEKAAAATVSVDAIAAVDYARFITETGLILVAVPVGLASLPRLAIMPSTEFRSRVISVLPPFLVLSVTFSSLLAVFSQTIVSMLFGRGAFNEESIRVTSAILFGMSLGLWAQMLMYFLCRALNSRSLNRQSTLVVATFVILAVTLRYPFIAEFGAGGLGWAVSLASVVAVGVAVSILAIWRALLVPLALMAPAMALSAFLVFHHVPGLLAIVLFTCGWVLNVLAFGAIRRPTLGLAAKTYSEILRRNSQTNPPTYK